MESKDGIYFTVKNIFSKLGLNKVVPMSWKIYIKQQMMEWRIRKFVNDGKIPYKKGEYKEGINLIGAIKAEMGLGQSCRLIANMIKETHYGFSVYNYDFAGQVKEDDSSFDEYISEELPYEINIFHVNPCELGNLFMGRQDLWNGKYNIAFWLWELEEFPKEWRCYCQLFDEIWTPSEFAGRAIRKVTDIPIKILPYYVPVPYNEQYGRKEFSLPEDKFLFLVMYDINSTEGRKNPQGAIKAYKEAFDVQNKDVGLVIKINNGSESEIQKLKKQLAGYENVYYMKETIDKGCVNSLIRCCDVFVSLHRAEGFGLVMAEAMLLGTPVVATDWSSNTEFMSADAACMVGCQMIKNPRTEGLYRKGCIWAEPDCGQAAEYMKRLWLDKDFYLKKKEGGKQYVNDVLNKNKLVARLKEYLGLNES